MVKFPEIYKGQQYNVEGELYELIDFRVTNVSSKKNFTTTAFFKSLEANSKNPLFEEQIKNVIDNPIFEIILNY